MRHKKKFILTTILFILVCLLRFPSLFEPYWHGDEGITLTVGQQLRRGFTLYKEITDNKTPLLYFLAAQMLTLSKFKWLTLFWNIMALIFFLKLTKVLALKRDFFASLIFIFLTSTPVLEGNIVNGEIYGILPMIASAWLFWQRFYFLSGVLASLAFLFKHPFLFEFLAFFVFFIFFRQCSFQKLVSKGLRLILGFLLPILLTIGYFYQREALKDFVQSAFLNNFKYISWKTHFLIPHGLTVAKMLILALFVGFLYKKRGRFSQKEVFVFLWFAFSLFGATLSARPYPHYLLQVVPSFSLLVGGQFSFLRALLIFFSFMFAVFQFKINLESFKKPLFYYQNFLQGNSYEFYDQRVKTTYKLAAFLKENTKWEEPIFVWSNNTLIYPLSQRGPAAKYVAAYHLHDDPLLRKETIEKLSSVRPRFVIVTLPIRHPFPQLFEFLSREYNLIEKSSDYQIYEIKD